jgi:RNA recognition motif-containing protein
MELEKLYYLVIVVRVLSAQSCAIVVASLCLYSPQCLPLASRFAASSANLTETAEQELYMTNIFVGNLSYSTTQDDLVATFSQFGNVERVNVVTDRDSGQPRGFAFVEMTDANAAQNAISQLNGAELNGRAMNVNEARPKSEGRPAGRGGFNGPRRSSGRGRW